MKKIQFNLLLALFIICLNCQTTTNPILEDNIISIDIDSSEVYEYHTGVGGDEEGASIIVQAKHFEISDIIRNAETRWEAIYTYKPESRYRGTDYVEIEISSGSDGASPPTTVKRVRIRFRVL